MYDDILVEGYGKQLIHIDKNGVLDVTAID